MGLKSTKTTSSGGENKITPRQGEFGKWHLGWGRENRQPFFTVYGSVSPGVLDVLVDGKPGGTKFLK